MSDSSEELDGPGRQRSGSSSLQKVFHEELVLQWIVSHPNLRMLVLNNAWFFFELLVRVYLVLVCACVQVNTVVPHIRSHVVINKPMHVHVHVHVYMYGYNTVCYPI